MAKSDTMAVISCSNGTCKSGVRLCATGISEAHAFTPRACAQCTPRQQFSVLAGFDKKSHEVNVVGRSGAHQDAPQKSQPLP
jgi:hypothetical protein